MPTRVWLIMVLVFLLYLSMLCLSCSRYALSCKQSESGYGSNMGHWIYAAPPAFISFTISWVWNLPQLGGHHFDLFRSFWAIASYTTSEAFLIHGRLGTEWHRDAPKRHDSHRGCSKLVPNGQGLVLPCGHSISVSRVSAATLPIEVALSSTWQNMTKHDKTRVSSICIFCRVGNVSNNAVIVSEYPKFTANTAGSLVFLSELTCFSDFQRLHQNFTARAAYELMIVSGIYRLGILHICCFHWK